MPRNKQFISVKQLHNNDWIFRHNRNNNIISEMFPFRQQHDWQPKGEQKMTGGQNWQGIAPVVPSATWTSPSYGQPMVNSQSNLTTQSTMVNTQQTAVNTEILCCSGVVCAVLTRSPPCLLVCCKRTSLLSNFWFP